MSSGNDAATALLKTSGSSSPSKGISYGRGVLDYKELAEVRGAAEAILELVLNSSVLLNKRNPRLDAHLIDGGRALVPQGPTGERPVSHDGQPFRRPEAGRAHG